MAGDYSEEFHSVGWSSPVLWYPSSHVCPALQ